jgi:hypothetical protein
LDVDALEEALGEREDDLRDAFEHVRDRVQFTWRGARSARGAQGGQRARKAESGAEYLRRAAQAAKPSPPASWRPLRSKLARLVVDERYQPGSASVPDSLYQLVRRNAASRYAIVAAARRQANPQVAMTGPWPPFAFVPEML